MSHGLLTAAQRPVPLIRRNDVVVARIEDRDGPGWVVMDPLALVYHRLEPAQHVVWERLDGRVPLEELERALLAEFPTQPWSPAAVRGLLVELHRLGLVVSARLGQGPWLGHREQSRRIVALLGSWRQLLSLRLPGWNPDPFLIRLLPYVRWIYHPAVLTLASLAVLSGAFVVLIEFAQFQRRLPEFQQFFGWPNLLWLWVALAVTKLWHEFGHALTCRYFGAACHEMGVMLLVFSPTMYCDVSDAWRLPSRWERMAIAAAGMGAELVLSTVALVVWWCTQPGLVHYLMLNTVFVTTLSTVVFNANPLLRYDGYYILSDWLGIPNLRAKADRLLQRTFSRGCLGIEPFPDPLQPAGGQFWLGLYAVSAQVYGWFVTGGILWFLYSWLKPYGLQSLGQALAVGSLAGIAWQGTTTMTKLVRQPRNGPVKRWRPIVCSLALCAVLAGLACWPIPWFVEAAVLIEPADAHELRVTTPGTLAQPTVQPDALVTSGTPLVVLESPELVDRIAELERERSRILADQQTQRALGDVAAEAITREQRANLEGQLTTARAKQTALTLVAPIAGRIVAAPSATAPRPPELPTWTGAPTDPRNQGAYLEAGTHVLSIAPSAQWQGVLYLDQADRNDIAVGDLVRIQLDPWPARILSGRIRSIAAEESHTVPPALTQKTAGPLVTITAPDGREELLSVAYRAVVELDDESLPLRHQLRGSARVLVETRSIAGWLHRWFRRTLHFRL